MSTSIFGWAVPPQNIYPFASSPLNQGTCEQPEHIIAYIRLDDRVHCLVTFHVHPAWRSCIWPCYRLAQSRVVPTLALRLGSEPSVCLRFSAACTAFLVQSATSIGDCEDHVACLGSPSTLQPGLELEIFSQLIHVASGRLLYSPIQGQDPLCAGGGFIWRGWLSHTLGPLWLGIGDATIPRFGQ